jgi:hypothetical protein
MAASLNGGKSVRIHTGGEFAGFVDLTGKSKEQENTVEIKALPRIGVYSPWSGSMDEGWMRYTLDRFEIPYVTVRNEMLRAGDIEEFLDVLIVPSVSGREIDDGRRPGSVMPAYERGLDPEGAIAVEEFVRGGGKLITMASSASWAIDLLELPVKDVTRGTGFSCPGSVLRGIVNKGSAHEQRFTGGLDDSVALFFSGSNAWEISKEGQGAGTTLLTYAPTRVLMSGWINEPEVIEDQGAWVRFAYGEGAVHLFGFRPQYRGWSQATMHLLFRAVFLEE